MATVTQAELIARYNDEVTPDFNSALFERSDEKTIEELQNIILSCQRDNKLFRLKVVKFKVIDDYFEIQRLLREHEELFGRRKNKSSRKRENTYDYIDLKESDIKLLIVTYFMSIKGVSRYLNVYIAIPRIVNKFYFRLNGSIYSSMYQIVETSTYNNTTSSTSKKHSITFRTILANLNIYRNNMVLKSTKKDEVRCTYYQANVFSKSLPAMKYILAKYGLYGTFKLFNVNPDIILITREDPDDDSYYTFMKKEGIYISSPKYLFDNERIVQSLVHSIYSSIIRATNFEDVFTREFWVRSLGASFNNDSYDKGTSILDSIEHIYDISTQKLLVLPPEVKCDIYHILRWLMCEFSNLRVKDNLDLATKRIRYSEYIAALYAAKLSTGIYHISDLGNRADIDSIRKAINTDPMYLIEEMQRSKLVNYRNMVTDCDSFAPLKYTYKGVGGIGEKSSNSVPDIFKMVNITHIGRVDVNSSSNSDPGLSGIICPLLEPKDNGFFGEYEEPMYWDKKFGELLDNYKKMLGRKELYKIKREFGLKADSNEEENLDGLISLYRKIIPNPNKFDTGIIEPGIPLEEGGLIRWQ